MKEMCFKTSDGLIMSFQRAPDNQQEKKKKAMNYKGQGQVLKSGDLLTSNPQS